MSTAIVIGAGIGGMTAALALEQCGWDVTLLERTPELREVGAGLSIWPSTVDVLEALGVDGLETVARPGAPAGMRQPSGRWILEAADLGIEVPVMIHRSVLHEMIRDRFGPGVTIRTGVAVTDVAERDERVVVTADTDEFGAELVVAADGIRSLVRTTLHPAHPGPRYSGYTAYRGLADVDVPDGGGETWGRGQRFGFARLIDGRTYWYGTANRRESLPSGPDTWLDEASELFGSWHDPIPELLAATRPDRVLRNDIHDLALPLAPFTTGRIALLGDAAHAMTPNLGRGACAAIEDAGALARHLSTSESLASALAGYDAERRPATAKLIRRSRAIGRVGQVENRVLRGLRDSAIGLVGRVVRVKARAPRTPALDEHVPRQS